MTKPVSYKLYMRIFDVSRSTAQRMITIDRRRLGRKPIVRDILPHYGLDLLDVAPYL